MAGGKSAIPIRSREDIGQMAVVGALAAQLRRDLGRRVKPGVTTLELNDFADDYMTERGAYPAQKGFHGYPYAICAAVNDCVCHGLPNDRPLRDGDLVTLDFVVEWNGWMADTAWTYGVGQLSPEHARLRAAAYRAMMNGIAQTRPKRTLGDVAEQVRLIAETGNYGVISQFGGHGIGRAMHEPPEVPFVGHPGKGVRLREGMVITIEPMLTIGSPDIYMKEDGWSIMTEEGGWAAQFEHTVAITEDGPLILTK
ncbi:type I methionyl aminopeptidase [Cohnella yongneupensis]|uniref:Methionine aminopeptidase n=1 Tax=Cohnella yongneupensis TaxID=425006 RepID=A0ABW0R2Y7_9BACL